MKASRGLLVLLIGFAGALLAGCGGSDHSDLTTFVDQVKAEPYPPIKAMPSIVRYQPYTYNDGNLRSPFVPSNNNAGSGASKIHPNVNRPLEPLQKFPLDSLTMVGTITYGGVMHALIQDPNGVVHIAAPGTYLGENYGEINRIDRSAIFLTEIVPNGEGGYKKHSAVLTPPTDGTQ